MTHLPAIAKPAIGFEFWFGLIAVVVFAPAGAWLLNELVAFSGQRAISNNNLVAFFLSLHGILFLLFSLGMALAMWFAEQVGLFVISTAAVFDRKVSVSLALWEKIIRIPALVRLGLLQAMFYGAAGIPFVCGIGLTYWLFLGSKDINYYLTARPWEWWAALAVAGTFVVEYLVVAMWMYVRWLFSVPAIIYEDAKPMGALRTSWQRTRGRFRELSLPFVVWWGGVLGTSMIITWLIRAGAVKLLREAELSLKVILPTVVVALVLIALVQVIWFTIGKIVHVMLMVGFYTDSALAPPRPVEPGGSRIKISPKGLRRIGWVIAGFACFTGVGSGVVFLETRNINRTIAITAHRGSSLKAPENTLSAIRQAISDGADYAEIDVQTTLDGIVVLMHDADFMRIASVNRRIDEATYEELKGIDVGSWFAPDFSGERIATLQETMDIARGRIKLNIELKYNRPDPELAGKVAHIIQDKGFSSECVITSLSYLPLLETGRLLPDVKTGLIVAGAVGEVYRVDTDFLSISAARATSGLVREAHSHGKKVHVWTVNDVGNALSMIEVGADNIITDNPALLRNLLDTWNELSDSEKTALMLRNLFIVEDVPVPDQL
ncbi:MAG: glycerophosphoryl diester phosphodiesterase membrane domain-containing protein [Deltaproteobacteria bacterium]|nr:glycerophosphoryl diester phosphodiesterase membrane domain-containing protein [Deltaproteobacteria bacterium]